VIKEEKGQSITELALVLPVLLLILCGILDFGRLLYIYMHLNLVSQESARLGGLGKSDAAITTFAKESYQMGEPETLEVIISPSDTSRYSGGYVTVELRTAFYTITPLLSEVLPSPYTIMSKSTIRVE
jgi:Flp pilus assembly protein TadG